LCSTSDNYYFSVNGMICIWRDFIYFSVQPILKGYVFEKLIYLLNSCIFDCNATPSNDYYKVVAFKRSDEEFHSSDYYGLQSAYISQELICKLFSTQKCTRFTALIILLKILRKTIETLSF